MWYFIFNDSFRSWQNFSLEIRAPINTHSHPLTHSLTQTLCKQIDQWGMKVLSCEYNRFYSLFWLKKSKSISSSGSIGTCDKMVESKKKITRWRGSERRRFLWCERFRKVKSWSKGVCVCICELCCETGIENLTVVISMMLNAWNQHDVELLARSHTKQCIKVARIPREALIARIIACRHRSSNKI